MDCILSAWNLRSGILAYLRQRPAVQPVERIPDIGDSKEDLGRGRERPLFNRRIPRRVVHLGYNSRARATFYDDGRQLDVEG